MNIYILDQDIERCARYHSDRHLLEGIADGARLLCTALNKKGLQTPCRSTQPDHPCVLWLEASFDNFLWLKDLVFFLNDEYRYRFDAAGDHAAIEVLRAISGHRYGRRGPTPFAQFMPKRYKVPGDAVQAYRRFYIAEHLPFAHWTGRGRPDWAESIAAVA